MSQLTKFLSQYWAKIQGSLFSWVKEELDFEKQQQLIAILELVRIEEFLPCYDGNEGRPQKIRSAIAKMVYTTVPHEITRLASKRGFFWAQKKALSHWLQKTHLFDASLQFPPL
jgi:hypothetical protein